MKLTEAEAEVVVRVLRAVAPHLIPAERELLASVCAEIYIESMLNGLPTAR